MDAFYASVEQRDNPELKGKPVAVGGGHRGVVTAASYEARPYGVRSALPSVTAKRLCPELIFVKPRFDVYRTVSHQIRAIFGDYTDLVDWSLQALDAHFGSSADWYWRICRGIDEREVKPDRPYKSVSAERTFDEDLRDPDRLAAELTRIAGYAWDRVSRAEVVGRTVTLKVKYGDFTLITRSKSFAAPVPDVESFTAAGQGLLAALHPLPKGIRLLGLGLHNLCEEQHSAPLQLGLAI